MAKAVAGASYEESVDPMKELNSLGLIVSMGAMAIAGLHRLWNDREESKDAFEKLVLEAGLGNGFEDRAWEIWELARKDRLKDCKRLYKAEAMLEQCDELAHLVNGLKALGRMQKDPGVPPMVKKTISAHWFNKLFDFCGANAYVAPGDFTDELGLAAPTEREVGLRRDLAIQRKSAAFWEREARRLANQLDGVNRERYEHENIHDQ